MVSAEMIQIDKILSSKGTNKYQSVFFVLFVISTILHCCESLNKTEKYPSVTKF